jgi:CHAT domain-containing protein/tetratricopeptide (TPR) repeat protein
MKSQRAAGRWSHLARTRAASARIVAALGPLCIAATSAACADKSPRTAALSGSTSRAQYTIDSLLAAGDSLYRVRPDSAAGIWATAFIAARDAGDSVRMTLALTGRAQAASQLGQLDSARAWGEQALSAKRRLGMNAQLFRSLNALGLLAWREDRTADATRLFAEASAAAQATGDSSGLAKARMNQGLVLQEQAFFAEALAAFTEAQQQFERLRDTVNLARTLNNRASLEIALGQPQRATALLAASRALAQRTADSSLEANARGQLAVAWAALGEPQRAFAMIDSAIALARAMGARPEVAENLRVVGDLYLDAGDARHALDSYRAATALQDSLAQPVERGALLRQQARAHRLEGNLLAATRLARQASLVHDSVGALSPAFDDVLLLLDLAMQRGEPREERTQLARLETLASLLDTPLSRARYAMAVAQERVRNARWRDVFAAIDSARVLEALVGPDERAEWHLLQAQAHAGSGDAARAVEQARRAVTLVEQVRARHASGELRARYTETRARVYAELTLALLREGNVAEAFAVADAARGRTLLELLGEAREHRDTSATAQRARDGGGAGTGLPDNSGEGDILLRRIDALVQRLRLQEVAPRRDRSAALLASSAEMRDSLRLLRSSYEALHARARVLPGRVATAPRLADVQQVLEGRELLLEYLATPDQLIVFVVTRDDARSVRIPLRADSLAMRLSLARALMEPHHGSEAANTLLAVLHRDLLAPALALARQMPDDTRRTRDRLVIIPHGLLSALPFAALRDGRSGKPVVHDWSLLQVPNAATLVSLRRSPVAPHNGRIHAFAPLTTRLPATRREVRAVAALARDNVESVSSGSALHRGRAVVHEDDLATEQQLRSAVQEAGIVHVASHATVNGHNPLFSRLDLQPSAEHDGRLEVHEILTLAVRSPLVFLSGCETAIGNVRTSRFESRDEFTSLAHAWLIAGARTVIATLWRIDDNAAAIFAGHFYEALRTQAAPEALATAQRAMLARPEHRAPYLWAAYQVVGAP